MSYIVMYSKIDFKTFCIYVAIYVCTIRFMKLEVFKTMIKTPWLTKQPFTSHCKFTGFVDTVQLNLNFMNTRVCNSARTTRI